MFNEGIGITLLDYFLELWDKLVVAIGNITTTINLEDVVEALLLEEMRWKTINNMTKDNIFVTSFPISINKCKSMDRSKYRGRSKY